MTTSLVGVLVVVMGQSAIQLQTSLLCQQIQVRPLSKLLGLLLAAPYDREQNTGTAR